MLREMEVIVLKVSQNQMPPTLRGASKGGWTFPVSRLVERVKVVLGHYRASCMKANYADTASVKLSEQLLKTLNQKKPVLKTVQRIFSSKSTLAAKQINKARTADLLQQSGLILAEREGALSLTDIETLAYQLITELPNGRDINALTLADRQQLKKYIHKAAPSAWKWFKNNLAYINRPHQDIQDRVRALHELGDEYDIDVTSLQSDFHQYVLSDETDRGRVDSQMLSALLEIEQNPQAFYAKDGTKLLISGSYLQRKGAQWVAYRLPAIAKQLEHRIEEEIKDLKDGFSSSVLDWEDLVQKEKINQRLMTLFSRPDYSELGANCPRFLRQLIQCKLDAPENYTLTYQTKNHQWIRLESPLAKEKGKVWRQQTFPQEVEHLEQALVRQYTMLMQDYFSSNVVPASGEVKSMLANMPELEKDHPILTSHPTLLERLLDAVLKDSKLFFHPVFNKYPAQNKFRGGYLKRLTNPCVEKTRVKAASGKVYELLNRLSHQDEKDVLKQYSIIQNNKVLLGEGGFGKVRLARDLETGQILAVKKFSVDKKDRPVDAANAELVRFDLVRQAYSQKPSSSKPSTSQSSLHDYRDYAHVKATSHKKQGVFDKSYVFMDLANQGSGHKKIDRLERLRRTNQTHQAQKEFIRIAKQYTKSVADLHELGFSHRDIKPANFLHFMTKEGQENIEHSKLADFGFLKNEYENNVFGGGSYGYFSPEALLVYQKRKVLDGMSPADPNLMQVRQEYHELSRDYYDAKLHDSFSLGVSLFKLYKAAFGHEVLTLKDVLGNKYAVNVKILQYGNVKGLKFGSDIVFDEGNIEHVIAQLLNEDKDQRITPKEAYDQLIKVEEITS